MSQILYSNFKNFMINWSVEKQYITLNKNLNIHKLLCTQLPTLLQKYAHLNLDNYLLSGSIGQGNISEVPWLCIFDKEITITATKGYYLVYLFKSDMSGFYLSLNQGWTQFKDFYGTKEGKIEIYKSAKRAKSLLKSTDNVSFKKIDLRATKPLGKGYELGNICSKYYSFNDSITDSVLINDLRDFVSIYKELKSYINLDIFALKNKLSEEEYQEESQIVKAKNLPNGPVEKKSKNSVSSSSSWIRDPEISKIALEKSNFLCENDSSHKTFISESTGKQFVEAHHLIPMKFQDLFNVSIDIPENIISLCPNCHKEFHLSKKADRSHLINKFVNKREKNLMNRGIYVSNSYLNDFYFNSNDKYYMKRTFHTVGHGGFYTEEFYNSDLRKIYNVVYDCGSKKSIKHINYLIDKTFNKFERIDALFISHFHEDHINGLEYILKNCSVNKLFVPHLSEINKIQLLIENTIKGTLSKVTEEMILNIKSFVEKRSPSTDVIEVVNIEDPISNDLFAEREFNIDDSIPKMIKSSKITIKSFKTNKIFWIYEFDNIFNPSFSESLYISLSAHLKQPTSKTIAKWLKNNKNINGLKKLYFSIIKNSKINENSLVLLSISANSLSQKLNNTYSMGHESLYTNNTKFHSLQNVIKNRITEDGCLFLGDYDLTSNYLHISNKFLIYKNRISTIQVPHHGSIDNFNNLILGKDQYFVISIPNLCTKGHHPNTTVINDINANNIAIMVNRNEETILSQIIKI